MTQYLIHEWYGDLRASAIKRTTETHHWCDRWSKLRDDPSIVCVTNDPKGTLDKLRPIYANYREAARITSITHAQQMKALRDERDAAVREVLGGAR